MWICISNLDQIIWLTENYKWAWHLNLFSGTRVYSSPLFKWSLLFKNANMKLQKSSPLAKKGTENLPSASSPLREMNTLAGEVTVKSVFASLLQGVWSKRKRFFRFRLYRCPEGMVCHYGNMPVVQGATMTNTTHAYSNKLKISTLKLNVFR